MEHSFAANDHDKRPGRANIPRLSAVKTKLPEPDLGSGDQPAPFNAALELVRAASGAIERMRARCSEVEALAEQEIDYHREQLATAHTVLKGLNSKTAAQEESIRQLHAQADADRNERRRLQGSLDELQIAYEQNQLLLRAAQGRATKAEEWLGRLHSELASAFSDLR